MRIDAEKKSREQNDLKNHFVTAPLKFILFPCVKNLNIFFTGIIITVKIKFVK